MKRSKIVFLLLLALVAPKAAAQISLVYDYTTLPLEANCLDEEDASKLFDGRLDTKWKVTDLTHEWNMPPSRQSSVVFHTSVPIVPSCYVLTLTDDYNQGNNHDCVPANWRLYGCNAESAPDCLSSEWELIADVRYGAYLLPGINCSAIGGIAGELHCPDLSDCLFDGTLQTTCPTVTLGTIVGEVLGEPIAITRTLHVGKVKSPENAYVGNTVGYLSQENSYAMSHNFYSDQSFLSARYNGWDDACSLSDIERGKICFLLNDSQADENVFWTQTIGRDRTPSLYGRHLYVKEMKNEETYNYYYRNFGCLTRGDVDESTEVSVNDVVHMLKAIQTGDLSKVVHDANDDGSVNMTDVTDIAKGATGDLYALSTLVTSIALPKDGLRIQADSTYQMTSTVAPDNASNNSIIWTSSNESVATISPSGLIQPCGIGSTVITATAGDGSNTTASCTVTVFEALSGMEYVDLGLPSGTMWATENVGADTEYDEGLYFMWGETKGYPEGATGHSFNRPYYKHYLMNKKYDPEWYPRFDYETWEYLDDPNDPRGIEYYITKYSSGNIHLNDTPWDLRPQGNLYGYGGFPMHLPDSTMVFDEKLMLEEDDDAAHVNWGEGWEMPSNEQASEFMRNCTFTKVRFGNNIFFRATGPNGASVLLPAAGQITSYYSEDCIYVTDRRYSTNFWTKEIGAMNVRQCPPDCDRCEEEDEVDVIYYIGFVASCFGPSDTMCDYDPEYNVNFTERCSGLTIRPVIKAKP